MLCRAIFQARIADRDDPESDFPVPMLKKYLRLLRELPDSGSMARFEILKRISAAVFPAYRFKWPQMAWWGDKDFNAYLERFGELRGMNTDRRWMLGQLLRLTVDVPGDTAECGVYLGASSYLICKFNSGLAGAERQHFMFDSFEGLSAPDPEDGGYWRKGDLAVSLDKVAANLSGFSNTAFLKGWIPERFPEVADRRFSFVHIDVDLYEPTLESLRFFYPRMNPGGIILCDDYGFTTCPGATRAMDEYLRDKPEAAIALSCGGGFMVKNWPTQHP